eukprot:1147892-Pelagomonas_calceolata.AAC.5
MDGRSREVLLRSIRLGQPCPWRCVARLLGPDQAPPSTCKQNAFASKSCIFWAAKARLQAQVPQQPVALWAFTGPH